MRPRVVVGAANGNLGSLRREADRAACPIELLTNVTDMPAVMAWADVAVSAAGSTCWELAFMGLPMLLVISADNQIAIAEGLVKAGTALSLGSHTQLDLSRGMEILAGLLENRPLRFEMSDRGRALVDGLGAQRVIERTFSA
jgi:spore coat polysaccharide biosynthesis predicted glycosyltransferase SpsG